MSFVVGQIKVIGIVGFDPTGFLALEIVPADKINGVTKVIPIRTVIAGILPVGIPGRIQRLGITVGRRGAGARENPQKPVPGRFRFSIETGFLVNDCHHHRNGRSPALRCSIGPFIPAAFFRKNRADIFLVLGRRSSAPEERADSARRNKVTRPARRLF